MFVKICGLSSQEAIAAAIEAGVDAIGFVFAHSPRQVTPAAASRLAASVPRGILKVAVMHHPSRLDCERVFAEFEPDCVQTDAADFAQIALPPDCSALPVFREGDVPRDALPRRLLFEGTTSGSGRTANWREARQLAARCELILAGGLDADNVTTAIAEVCPFGVDVSSGVERRRGVKDPRKILEFVSRVRELEHTI